MGRKLCRHFYTLLTGACRMGNEAVFIQHCLCHVEGYPVVIYDEHFKAGFFDNFFLVHMSLISCLFRYGIIIVYLIISVKM